MGLQHQVAKSESALPHGIDFSVMTGDPLASQDSGLTALHVPASHMKEFTEVVILLVEAGWEPDTKDANGISAEDLTLVHRP